MTESPRDTPDQAPRSGLPDFADRAEVVRTARSLTPARVLVGRAGASIRTTTRLELLEDHAAAVDAVHAEVDLERDLGVDFVTRWGLFVVETRARTKSEFLMRPDLGRSLDDQAVERLRRCPAGADLQVAIGDGLSAAAVSAQVPGLLPLLEAGSRRLGWSFGQPFFVRRCRVGVLNDIGDLLAPRIAVLLIGERPGLLTARSLSAYMAYSPRAGQTDADRNLVSNIHEQGTPPAEAADRILRLAGRMMHEGAGGVAIKEEPPARDGPAPLDAAEIR